jgi:hypothetical protein
LPACIFARVEIAETAGSAAVMYIRCTPAKSFVKRHPAVEEGATVVSEAWPRQDVKGAKLTDGERGAGVEVPP